jgi:hypothetical protein
MPSITGRAAVRLATLTLLALLAGGCGGDSPSPTAAPATTTTAAPTTTTVPPLNAKELAWLKGVSAVRTKVENSFKAKGSVGSVNLTRAIVLEYNRQLASWGRQLRRLGAPSDRLQPADTLVRKVLQIFDKGAKCYARAAGVISEGGTVHSDREARMFEEAMDCGHAAEGNGAHVLYKADAKGDELKAKYG